MSVEILLFKIERNLKAKVIFHVERETCEDGKAGEKYVADSGGCYDALIHDVTFLKAIFSPKKKNKKKWYNEFSWNIPPIFLESCIQKKRWFCSINLYYKIFIMYKML